MGAEFGYSRRKLASGVAGAFAFVVTAVVLGIFAWSVGEPLWLVAPLSLVLAVLFTVLALAFLSRFGQDGPVVRIDATGITDRRLGPDPVPWNKIARVATVRLWGQDMLELKVAEPASYLAPPEPVMRLLAPVHRALGYSPLLVSPSSLEASFGDLLHAVRHFRPSTDLEMEPQGAAPETP